jgi:hypothetical protein
MTTALTREQAEAADAVTGYQQAVLALSGRGRHEGIR